MISPAGKVIDFSTLRDDDGELLKAELTKIVPWSTALVGFVKKKTLEGVGSTDGITDTRVLALTCFSTSANRC